MSDIQEKFVPHPLSDMVLACEETTDVIFYCARCGRPFWADPNRVVAMEKRALCLDCATYVVKLRAEHGLPVVPVIEDAYKGGYVDSQPFSEGVEDGSED